jgi:hypothetical protein
MKVKGVVKNDRDERNKLDLKVAYLSELMRGRNPGGAGPAAAA